MKALKAGDASRYTISDDDWLLMYEYIPSIICSLKKQAVKWASYRGDNEHHVGI